MSWLFGDSSTSKPTETIKSIGLAKKKRPVIDYVGGYNVHMVFNADLNDALQSAALMGDAEEVIACLNDSPRFKRHLCRVAEEKLEAKRKELSEAEVYAQKVCRV